MPRKSLKSARPTKARYRRPPLPLASFRSPIGRARRRSAAAAAAVGIEKKFLDSEYDGVIVKTLAGSESDPAGNSCLDGIAQGDGESNRDGRACTVTSLHLRGHIEVSPVDATAADGVQGGCVKLALVMDQQTNGAQLNAEDVFVDPTDTDLDAHTLRNLQYAPRFKILWMKQFNLGSVQGNANDTTVQDWSGWVIPFKADVALEMRKTFTATTAPVASCADNSLHLIAVQSPADARACQLRYTARVRFVG